MAQCVSKVLGRWLRGRERLVGQVSDGEARPS